MGVQGLGLLFLFVLRSLVAYSFSLGFWPFIPMANSNNIKDPDKTLNEILESTKLSPSPPKTVTKPLTLNPKPLTLNPKPSTLNRKPQNYRAP